jgi:hypothetical protein
VALSILHSVVDRKGGWIRYDGQQWNGANAFLDGVREDLDLAAKLERETLAAVQHLVAVSAN